MKEEGIIHESDQNYFELKGLFRKTYLGSYCDMKAPEHMASICCAYY